MLRRKALTVVQAEAGGGVRAQPDNSRLTMVSMTAMPLVAVVEAGNVGEVLAPASWKISPASPAIPSSVSRQSTTKPG